MVFYMISHIDLDPGVSSGIIFLTIVPRESLLVVSIHLEVALLDSTTTHTILRDSLFFSFIRKNIKAWQVCQMHTIVGRPDVKFCEGWATIVSHGGTTLLIDRAMYAPSVHRSLISFKDLQAHGIYTFTVVKDHEEALELKQGTEVIATAYARAIGLYDLPITGGTHLQSGLQTSLASVVSQS